MAKYHLEVSTGNLNYSGTFNRIFATLIGTDGQSDKIQLNIFGIGQGAVSCTIKVKKTTLNVSPEQFNPGGSSGCRGYIVIFTPCYIYPHFRLGHTSSRLNLLWGSCWCSK